MPFPSPELFLQAVYRAVEENKEFVPPYGSNGSLYIRPFVFGSGPQLGLSPAPEFKFMVVVNPGMLELRSNQLPKANRSSAAC